MNAWLPVIGGSVTGTSFNPQTQGTLVNWYDASTLGLSNGASVSSWTDSKTGAPNTMTNGGFSAGVYATGQSVSGLSTVAFNGSNRGYANGGSSASTFPYTIAAVINIPNTSAAYTILGPSGNGGLQFRTDQTTGNLTLNKAATAGIGTSTSGVGTAAYHVVVTTVTNAAYAFYIDGAAAGSGAHAQTLTAALTFRIGVSNSSEFFNSHIGEIQIYSSVLSAGDLTGCYNYLKAKWGTP